MGLTAQSLLADLDARLPATTQFWRATALRHILDLFLSGAELYGSDQIALFDAVMGRLIKNLNRTQLAELSNRLARVDNAPPGVLTSLARHADLAICGPVLEHAKGLSDADLADIANKERVEQSVLAKIATRAALSENLTDILLRRGDTAVWRQILDNPKAGVSERGFARLVSSIDGDKTLAAAIAVRPELPAELQPFLDAALSE